MAEPVVVVEQDRLHLAVAAFDPCRRPRVEARQGRAVVVVVGSVGTGGGEGLGKLLDNPAGWPLGRIVDIMGGRCLT